MIAEVSEAEENNMTHFKLGHHFTSARSNHEQPSSASDRAGAVV